MKTVPLGAVTKFVRGVTYKPSQVMAPDSPGAVGVMRTKNVQRELDLSDVVYVPEELVGRPDQLVQPGDILISSANSWNLVGKCSWVPKLEQPYAIGGFITGLRATSAEVDPRFLYQWVASPRVQTELRNTANQTTNIANLNLRRCAELPFPLPPLDEQRRIAAILDQADDIRTKQRNVATHFAGLAEAIFLDMFGDPDEALLSGAVVRFGEVADLQGGRNLVADDQDTVSEFRVLKISAVTSGKFKPSESKALPAGYIPPADHFVRQGDLLISRANTSDLVGAVAYVEDTPSNLVLPDKVWRFVWRNPDSDPLYYRSLFRTTSVRRRISQLASGTGGSMKNISKAKLVELELPAVTFAQQREFARRVGAIPRPAYTEIDALMSSLQSRAFAGQL